MQLYKSMHWSVCHLAGLLVGPVLLFQRLQCVASSFGLTAPAQSHATDAILYTVLPSAPALHITTPAQTPQLLPFRVSSLVFGPPDMYSAILILSHPISNSSLRYSLLQLSVSHIAFSDTLLKHQDMPPCLVYCVKEKSTKSSYYSSYLKKNLATF